MKTSFLPISALSAAALLSGAAFAAESPPIPFASATFTEVVNDVQVVPAGAMKGAPVAVQSVFNAPDLVRTGRKSRAQLTAADGSLARVGSNAVFSFDKSSRTMNLKQGSVLFHSPTGKGGGTVVTNSATAAVTGTTIIVTATSDGGFKMFVLEGVAKVNFPDGKISSIRPGQMTFVMPAPGGAGGAKGGTAGPVLNFDLAALAKDSGLVKGFERDLPSVGKINAESRAQESKIAEGDLVRTGLFVLGAGSADEFFLATRDAVQSAVNASNIAAEDAVRLQQALRAAYTYNGGPLPESFIFRTPLRLDPYGDILGFVAGHLVIDAPAFDMSQLDGLPYVDVLGAGATTLDIAGSTDFIGLSATRGLVIGGAKVDIADNAHVRVLFANAPTIPATVEFRTYSPLVMNGVILDAPGANLRLYDYSGDITMTGGSLLAGGALTVYASGKLDLLSGVQAQGESVSVFTGDDVTVVGGVVTANSGVLSVSAGGVLSVSAGAVFNATAGTVSLSAPVTMDLASVTVNSAVMNLSAGSQINLSGVTSGALTVNITAQTLVLGGVDFAAGAAVVLRTTSGQYNTSAGVVAGMLNFSGGVTLGGSDILQNGLIWAPEMGVGDPTKPIHLLTLYGVDFPATGAPQDYAKASDLAFGSGAIPGGNRFVTPVFLSESDLIPPHPGVLPAVNEYDLQGNALPHSATEVVGMLARHITLSGGTIDLAPFDGQIAAQTSPHVDIFAVGTLSWSGAFTVSGQGVNRNLEIRATGFAVTPGASYANTLAVVPSSPSDASSVSFVSVNALSLDTVTIAHAPGTVNVRSLAGDVTLNNTTLRAGDTTVSGPNVSGKIRVQSGGMLNITGGIIASSDDDIRLESAGDMTLDNAVVQKDQPAAATFQTPGVVYVAGTTLVSITGGQLKGTGIVVGGGAFGGGDLVRLDMDNVALLTSGGSPGIRLAALTVNLSNIDFPAGTQVRLRSEDGVLNIGSSLTGAVNFVTGIKYGGTNIMTVAGINSTIWIEQPNSVLFQGNPILGSPLEGATGVAQSLGAAVHVQTTGSADQPGQF